MLLPIQKKKTIIKRPFTPQEMAKFSDDLSTESVELSKLNNRKKEAVAAYDEQIKPKKANVTDLVNKMVTKHEEIEGEVFLIADHDNNVMETYDGTGRFISSRLLYPDERQTKIVELAKTGTQG